MIVGAGDYRYELIPDWEQLPEGIVHPDVSSVRFSAETDQVFVFNRSGDPILRYTRDGKFVDSWGGDYFTDVRGPHGMELGHDGTLWLVDMRRNVVEHYTFEGERIGAIPSGYLSCGSTSSPAFDKPTCAVLHPNGGIYVSDGYGNSYVHRFEADGSWRRTWGRPGAGPLEFAIPHGLAIAPDGNLLVADRENHRIQVLSPDGDYLRSIGGLFRPCAIHVLPDGAMIVPELGADTPSRLAERDVPSRISVLNPDGTLAARWGDADGLLAGSFVAAHDVCVDSEGSLYVAEVTHTMGVDRGLAPPGTHSLQKFGRV